MSLILDGTSGVLPPQWTTATRPVSPGLGQMGWNTTLNVMEVYVGYGAWQIIASTSYSVDYLIVAGGGGGGNGDYAGVANTGGGGGSNAKSGGSGIVIVRYIGNQRATGGIVSSSSGYTYHTFNSSGTFTA